MICHVKRWSSSKFRRHNGENVFRGNGFQVAEDVDVVHGGNALQRFSCVGVAVYEGGDEGVFEFGGVDGFGGVRRGGGGGGGGIGGVGVFGPDLAEGELGAVCGFVVHGMYLRTWYGREVGK